MTGKARNFNVPLSDLEFGDLLGQGGFGAVFRGKWKSKNMTVALKKTLTAPEVADANMMGLLGQHPNIVSFYAYTTDHPHTISVLELAENGSLNDYLYKANKKPDLAQSVNWAQDIAYGMAHLHNHDIVHRDLKSHNILFSTRMVAMVSDFGTARFLSRTTEATKTGTLRWMAPEVINEEKFNMKCDIYSYAMILLEMMEHKVPYDGANDFKAATLATSGQRPALGDNMPGYIHSLIESCWAHNPTERPPFCDIVIAMETKTYPLVDCDV